MNADLSMLREPLTSDALVLQGQQLVHPGGASYSIVNGIPRFVVGDNYAKDFGLQWNKFRKTQLDTFSGTTISEDRLSRCMNGHLEKINGKYVLEAGSGAGRFTEILLKKGAFLHSFDLSDAVDANAKNNGESDKLVLVQADIRKIPFPTARFDYVLCLGVIQHTPDPEETTGCLYDMVRPGGYLVFDHYIFRLRKLLPTPFGTSEALYRRFILSLPTHKRLAMVKRIVDFWFPIHWKFRESLLMQRLLRRVSPVHFYYPQLPLPDKETYYDWAFLDTYDGTTDYYKHHRTVAQIHRHLEALGASEIVVVPGGNGVEAFCRKPE